MKKLLLSLVLIAAGCQHQNERCPELMILWCVDGCQHRQLTTAQYDKFDEKCFRDCIDMLLPTCATPTTFYQ